MAAGDEMEEQSLVDSKERFTSRVDDYVKNRPRYPEAVIPTLRDKIGLLLTWAIAETSDSVNSSAENTN